MTSNNNEKSPSPESYKDKLFSLYKITIDEEHFFLEAHRKRVAFYMGIITGLLAGVITGLFKAEIWYEFLALIFGLALIFFISRIAKRNCENLYKRFLGAITVRAKLEYKLGLTNSNEKISNSPLFRWCCEPIVRPHHIESRNKYSSSDNFIEGELSQKNSNNIWTKYIFTFFQVISVLLAALLIQIIIMLECGKFIIILAC